MKFHVLQSKSFFGDSKEIEAFHASMFHGTADRGGKRPNRNNAYLAYTVDRPLQLHKNVYDIAQVFEAEGALVVSRAVREGFRGVPLVQFAHVHFKTLYRYPYRPGDYSYNDEIGDYFEQLRFIDELKHEPDLVTQVDEYFELAAPLLRDLRPSFDPLSQVAVQMDQTRDEAKEISISRQLLLQHSIYSCGAKVISELVFEKLHPYINWTYFEHGEGTI